ncbi:Reticulon-like protein B1 [Tetrabaena socialis]|uniref:Reticulon-like protein n=1 Tax=Tetrabaena socialis TaxID=47790 RepID=A0A2J8A324_9CHLO|nr:Reticulon-like protein B1 [Tetrabaena socialis]|eukprot:PNH06921.1 Reticulon-like protein B1 [Tetrabaena socialis]
MSKRVTLPFVSKHVEELLLWSKPKDSALVFGGATLAFAAYRANPFTAATIICYAVAGACLLAFTWAQAATFVNWLGPPVPAILTHGMTEEDARKVAESARPAINKALAVVGVLASGKDLRLSLLVAFGSYLAARIFALISPLTLAYIVVLLAFTLPKAYEAKHEDVDKVVKLIKDKVHEVGAKFNETVLSKIPKAKAI